MKKRRILYKRQEEVASSERDGGGTCYCGNEEQFLIKYRKIP